MKEITIKRIDSDSPEMREIIAINKEAFPSEEKQNVDEMLSFGCGWELLGFFRENRLIGFAIQIKNETTVYVMFFAIDRELRGQGLGSKAIRALTEHNGDLQVVLDFEIPLPEFANYEQRVRRKAFYLRNGFHETGRYTIMNGGWFEVVCAGERPLDTEGLKDLIRRIHMYTPGFEDRLI